MLAPQGGTHLSPGIGEINPEDERYPARRTGRQPERRIDGLPQGIQIGVMAGLLFQGGKLDPGPLAGQLPMRQRGRSRGVTDRGLGENLG